MKVTILVVFGMLLMTHTAKGEYFSETNRILDKVFGSCGDNDSDDDDYDEIHMKFRPVSQSTSDSSTNSFLLLVLPSILALDSSAFSTTEEDYCSQQKEKICDLRKLEKIIEKNDRVPSPRSGK